MPTAVLYQSIWGKICRLTPAQLAEVDLFLSKLAQSKPAKKAARTKKPRLIGSMKGLVRYMVPDFNAPLEEFKDYR